MTDLTKILGGPWTPSTEILAPPEEQLRQAIRDSGIEPPSDIILDGQIHRFNSGTKGKPGHDKPGWYVVYPDNVAAGSFGCWRADITIPWRADIGRELSPAEEMLYEKRRREAAIIRDEALKKSREAAANTADKIWASGSIANDSHPYLERKGISANGARVTGDGRLIVPLFDADGAISSLQYIDGEGVKRFHPGGKVGGAFWSIGEPSKASYIAEGFATAATIHECTGAQVFIAYSASNMTAIAEPIRRIVGDGEITIVADNDESGVGIKYAESAAGMIGARVIIPPLIGDANDYAMAGNDLSALLIPQSDWLISADDFSLQPAPIAWLIKRWIQRDALIMIHGPSGSGKTFVVLDWCLRMASGAEDWCGNKVRDGGVVYLAGEGHHGLRGRIAAWKHYNNSPSLNMWLSKSGCDLNTPEGYFKALDNIRAIKQKPSLIVVDTLHRFLSGDENSAQDAKTMLDACNGLMREVGCSVILVHHTGVSEEAQHRARGSSAWRGALDIEISVIPGKGDAPIQIIQRKSKDAEIAPPVYVELRSIEIPKWIDEDGEKVTSAVIEQVDAPPEKATARPPRIKDYLAWFDEAWKKSGSEMFKKYPYLTRSAFIDYLVKDKGKTPSTAQTYAKNGRDKGPIAELVKAGAIECHEHGWILVASAEAISANGKKRGDL